MIQDKVSSKKLQTNITFLGVVLEFNPELSIIVKIASTISKSGKLDKHAEKYLNKRCIIVGLSKHNKVLVQPIGKKYQNPFSISPNCLDIDIDSNIYPDLIYNDR